MYLRWLYHDTFNVSVNFDCIMIQWVSLSKLKEAWNGSFLLHLPCYYHFGYVHWLYQDTFKVRISFQCIMIHSRDKPEILSSNSVLVRKLPTVTRNKLKGLKVAKTDQMAGTIGKNGHLAWWSISTMVDNF